MRQFTLIVPKIHDRVKCKLLPCGLTEASYNAKLAILEFDLADAFGGCTRTEGRGNWKTADKSHYIMQEEVYIYTVLWDGTDIDACEAFDRLPWYIKSQFHQESVYLIGEVLECERNELI